jgi:hypothetical protein
MFIKGVLQEIIKASPILGGPYTIDAYGMKGGPALPFMEIEGNALTYNREVDASAMATWKAPLEAWTSHDEPTFAQVSTTLKIIGAQAIIDNYIQQTRSNKQDQTAAVIAGAAKAIAFGYEDQFIYGTGATVYPAGVHVLCNTVTPAGTYQRLTVKAAIGNTDTPLTTMLIHQLIDLVRPVPDILLMNRFVKNLLSQYAATKTSPIQYLPQQFGQSVTLFDGIPIAVSDFITQTELSDATGWYSAKTGGLTSSIFAIKFGERNLCGIQNGGVQKQLIGEAEGFDAKIWRLKWYCGLAEFATVSVACLSNIGSTGTAIPIVA